MSYRHLIIVFMLLVSTPTFAQVFTITNPDSIPFAPPVGYEVGDGPVGIFCTNLDTSPGLDLAVTNVHSNNVSILLNRGDGFFLSKNDYATGYYPYSVFCAQLNDDSYLDLAVANVGDSDNRDSTISILINNGNGGFSPRDDYRTGLGPHGPNSVFCADLDNDGDPDLAAANPYSDSVTILINNGNGQFDSLVNYGVGDGPNSVFCADIDTSPGLDLAITCSFNDSVYTFMNKGDTAFCLDGIYEVGDYPQSVFCADLNNDSLCDLAVVNCYDNNVSILINKGDGTFKDKVNYPTGSRPHSVFCADLDMDGDMDLTIANWLGSSVSILKNEGNGTFQSAVYYDVGDTNTSVFCADLDQDMDLDLVVVSNTNDSVYIMLNLINSRPDSISLLSPPNVDSVKAPITFTWQTSNDPDPNDSVLYDLHLSRSAVFNPDSTDTIIDLNDTTFTDSVPIKLWYWKVRAYDTWGAETWSNETTWCFYVYVCGDCNGDGKVAIEDVVYLVNYLFRNGPTPIPLKAGDVNCDGEVTIANAVYLVNYLFKGGPPPCDPNNDSIPDC